MSKIFFTVKMERYGDSELHSYVIGVFDTYNAAQEAGEENKEHRAGKYEPVIEMWTLQESVSNMVRFSLGQADVTFQKHESKSDNGWYFIPYRYSKACGILIGLKYWQIAFSWEKK